MRRLVVFGRLGARPLRRVASTLAAAPLAAGLACLPTAPGPLDDGGPPALLVDAGPAGPDGGGPPPPPDAGKPDAGLRSHDAGSPVGDGGPPRLDGGGDLPPPPDGGGGPFDPGPAPTDAMEPVPGELSIWQLDLPSLGLPPGLAEAAILIAPDGTLTLLDVGNQANDDDVREAVRHLNEDLLTVERGYLPRDPLQVEWIVLTHFHADHIGAFSRLVVDTDEPLTGVQGVIHRGFVEVGPAVTEADFGEVCSALRGPLAAANLPLCTGPVEAPCDLGQAQGTHPASGCPGLPYDLDLGGGAHLEIVMASGHVLSGDLSGDDVAAPPPFGHDDGGHENARSLAGVIRFGEVRYHFGGDLTGEGSANDPDLESHLIAHAGGVYGELGVDVAHAHHHARNGSNNATLVDALAPLDGRSRNVVAGISPAHVGSPHAEVLDTWAGGGRLGGGRFWVTLRATGGATHPSLEEADGQVRMQTVQGGAGYWVQAVPSSGAAPWALAYPAVRHGE